MKTVKFGIIGLGLMGREFASAAMRWAHLPGAGAGPEIVSICSRTMPAEREAWYRDGLGTVKQVTTDYREVLANPEVEAVYCAVPHNLHERMYIDIIRAGKHLMAEKPFGIDLKANEAIMGVVAEHPEVFVRCCSQYYFAPGMQRICEMIESDAFGRIIEVDVGLLHSSDLNPEKPISWKRVAEYNGEYGVMGDLAMHVCFVPFRAGWMPLNVRAVLSNLMPERPDGRGGRARCDTWDNATLLCESEDGNGDRFPFLVKTQRISPGERNNWYFAIKGMKAAARFSTRDINRIEVLEYVGGEQNWQTIQTGHDTTFASITGGIFSFGFSDLMLQMWAGFLYELEHGRPFTVYSGCVRPEETVPGHRLLTAALKSHTEGTTVAV